MEIRTHSAKSNGLGLVASGNLAICTHLPYKPFEYQEDSKVVGFDPDLLNLLAKDLGVTQNVVNIEWSQITSGAAFAAKKCDLGMVAMTITEERRKALAISDPYLDSDQALLIKRNSPCRSLVDLMGKKVGVQAGTTGQKYAAEQAKRYGFTVVVFDDLALQTSNVVSGRVDAAINDNGGSITPRRTGHAKDRSFTGIPDRLAAPGQ